MSKLNHYFWNPSEKRLRAGWRLTLQLMLNLGGAIVFVTLVPHTPLNQWPTLVKDAVGYSILLAITLFSVWFAGCFFDRREWHDFGITPTQLVWWQDFGVGAAVGMGLIILLAGIAVALGIIRLELTFTSGIAGLPFPVAILMTLLTYGAVGCFEESARAYQIRNLFEGFADTRLGLRGAAVISVSGAAMLSVMMHSGTPLFLLYVFVSMSILGLFYLLTGRAAMAMGYHVAWDFTLTAVFGIGALLGESEYVGLFTPHLTDLVQTGGDGVEINGVLILMATAVVVLQITSWLPLLGWVYWRTGHVRIRAKMAYPTLRSKD